MKLGRPPIVPALPIAMIGISAPPAGSSGKMLHQLREQGEGATATFLLQRISPLLAHRDRGQGAEFTSAFGGAADVRLSTALAGHDANDPSETLPGQNLLWCTTRYYALRGCGILEVRSTD